MKGHLKAFLISTILITQTVVTPALAAQDIFKMSLEEILNEEVTSVSRKAESPRDTASAVYVIRQEDLRRNHVTHITEALRMVPGMHVERIDAGRWAVNTREGTQYFNNRLLILIDGRTLYTPVFSGTWWTYQDFVLEDIERIEVIRGPGAVMWGANAVNGVVNIITKHSGDTIGTMASVNVGTEDNWQQFRHGFQIGDNWTGRLQFRNREADNSKRLNGGDNNDDWDLSRYGFRMDGKLDESNRLTVQSDGFRGTQALRGGFPAFGTGFLDHDGIKMRGISLLGRWDRALDDGGSLQVQSYYDRVVRLKRGVMDFRIEIYDVEFQHLTAPGQRHEMVWGGSFRLAQDDFGGNPLFFYTPDEVSRRRWTGFLQYDYEAIENTLNFIAGTKLEHNDFSGFEYQPSVKAIWRPSGRQTVWASISRAVRTPDRSEHDITFSLAGTPPAGPSTLTLIPAPDTKSEYLKSLEVGHRWQLTDRFSWDLALYAKRFEDELRVEFINPTTLINGNLKGERFYGGEILIDWRPADWWQIQGWWAHINPRINPNSATRNHANIRSYINLPGNIELDGTLRFTDARQVAGAPDIPSYTELDVRIGWQATPEFDISLGLQHLLDDRTVEAPVQNFVAFQQAEIERAFNLKLTWTPR